MKKRNFELCLIIFLFVCISGQNCFAQSKEELLKQKAELEAEIAEIEAARAKAAEAGNVKNNTENVKTYCFEKVVYREVSPMSNEEFEQFCKKEISKLSNQNIEGNYSIIGSCKQTPNGVQANFCITTNPNVVNSADIIDRESKEKELNKIRNTKKMYEGLIKALDDQIKTNQVEIVDEGLNLGLKHINIKSSVGDLIKSKIKDFKDNTITTLKKKYNLDEHGIENENAQLLDDMTNQAESLMSIIPEGDLITCHYLWRILKSLPEAGKILGQTGAMINIYFRINEYKEKLKQLEEEEKRLLIE